MEIRLKKPFGINRDQPSIPIGTTFTSDGAKGTILLRTYKFVVDLNVPSRTWTDYGGLNGGPTIWNNYQPIECFVQEIDAD